ncbi:MAG: CPBP family intramembrane metalloprotease [Syntrophomonadaceae bacterium]|nr:CPBP family intramembrane metalloprotease [Syntrophomonadaceae bacterium]
MNEDKELPSSWVSLKEAVILMALIAIIITITAPLINVAIKPWPAIWRFFILTVWQSLVVIGMVGLVFFSRRLSLKDLGLGLPMFSQGLGPGIYWGTGIFIAVIISGMVMQQFLPIPPKPQAFAEVLLAAQRPVELGAGILIAVVVAPLAEELLFRGLLFPAMRERVGPTAAIILNGVLFAGVHMDLFRFIPLAVGGMFLAWLFNRSRNLYVAIAAHGTWNALMLAVLLLGKFA